MHSRCMTSYLLTRRSRVALRDARRRSAIVRQQRLHDGAVAAAAASAEVIAVQEQQSEGAGHSLHRQYGDEKDNGFALLYSAPPKVSSG